MLSEKLCKSWNFIYHFIVIKCTKFYRTIYRTIYIRQLFKTTIYIKMTSCVNTSLLYRSVVPSNWRYQLANFVLNKNSLFKLFIRSAIEFSRKVLEADTFFRALTWCFIEFALMYAKGSNIFFIYIYLSLVHKGIIFIFFFF